MEKDFVKSTKSK